jgi:DNA primase
LRISENYKNKVVAASDLAAVVGKRVELRKSGRELVGLCPFHNEKTASFFVNPDKQVYKCHGCGAGGEAIQFLMDFEGLPFHDAVELLAEEASMLPVEYEGGEGAGRPVDHSPLYDALEKAAVFFEDQLQRSQEAKDYCATRGISAESLRRFRIGWAPARWDGLTHALIHVPQPVLLAAGLVVAQDGGRVHDRFRARLMFPILDRRGRVIAFGGRVIDQTGGPKYLNSPETELFHKGSELFGLWQVRHPARGNTRAAAPAPSRVVVVEGYTDVVALHQHDLPIAVATLGTSMSAAHAESLFPVAPSVCFCFDGDAAGRGAAWRALEAILPLLREGRSASFLFLPEGEDPDSLVRKESGEAFLARVDSATPLSEYLFDHLSQEVNLSIPEGRARLMERALPLIRKLPAGPFQSVMLSALEARTGVVARTPRPEAPRTRPPQAATPPAPAQQELQKTLPRFIAALVMAQPALADHLDPPYFFADLPQPGVPFLVALLDRLKQAPSSTPEEISEHFRGTPFFPEVTWLRKLVLGGEEPDALLAEFRDGVVRLVELCERHQFDALATRARELGGLAALSPEEVVRYRFLMTARVRRDRERGARSLPKQSPVRLVESAPDGEPAPDDGDSL